MARQDEDDVKRRKHDRDERRRAGHEPHKGKASGEDSARAEEVEVMALECERHKSGRKRVKRAKIRTGDRTWVAGEEEVAEHLRAGRRLYGFKEGRKEYVDASLDELSLVLLEPAAEFLIVEAIEEDDEGERFPRGAKHHDFDTTTPVPPVIVPGPGPGGEHREEHQVTCITRAPHEYGRSHIQRLGIRQDEKIRELDEKEVVRRIQAGERFYVARDGYKAFLRVSVSDRGRPFVETEADKTTEDNLAALPHCRTIRPIPWALLLPLLGLLALLVVLQDVVIVNVLPWPPRTVTVVVPQTVARQETVLVPQTVAVVQTVAVPQTVTVPQTVSVPQTVIVPQTVPVPQTVQVPITTQVQMTVVVPAVTQVPVYITACRASPPVQPTETTPAGMRSLVRNGSFEEEFSDNGVGQAWFAFDNGADHVGYGYHDDTWPPVVATGCHSQLVEVDTTHFNSSVPGRFAGIAQTISGLVPGASYQLSLRGEIRTNEGDPHADDHSYVAQWGIDPQGGQDWHAIKTWQDLPWYHVYYHFTGGPLNTYSTHVVAPSTQITLYFRLYKSPPSTGNELNLNLDDITFVGP